MKRLTSRAVILATCLLAIASASCATIDPKADPIIVRSEQTIQGSFDTADAFLQFEAANQPWIKASIPAAHSFAETVRKDGPFVFRTAWAALQTYKASKSITAGTALSGALAKVEAIAAQARDYLLSVKPPGT